MCSCNQVVGPDDAELEAYYERLEDSRRETGEWQAWEERQLERQRAIDRSLPEPT